MLRRIRRWWRRDYNHKYVNGGKGTISIMLCILLLPFSTFAAAMIETGRYHSAVSVLDQAMNNAAVSTLSNYDPYLRERFGLNATKQKNQRDIYINYLEKNIETTKAIDLKNSDIQYSGKYSLNDTEILRGQILEASKFSVPTALTGDFIISELITMLEKMTHLTNFFKLITGASGFADSLVTVSEDMEELKDLTKNLQNSISVYNESYNNFKMELNNLKQDISLCEQKYNYYKSLMESYGDTGKKIMELNEENKELSTSTATDKQKIEEKIAKNKKEIENLEKNLEDDEVKKYKDADKEYEKAKSSLQKKVQEMKASINKYKESISDLQSQLIEYQKKADLIVTDLGTTFSKAADFGNSVAALSTDNTNDTKDLENDKQKLKEKQESAATPEERNQIQSQITDIEDQITNITEAKKNEQEIGKETKNGIDSVHNTLKAGMDNYKSDSISAAISALSNIYIKLEKFNIDNVTSETSLKKTDYYYHVSGYVSLNILEETIENAENELEGTKGIIKTLKALVGILENVFKVSGIYDGRLDAYIGNIEQYEPGDIDLILGDISDLMNIFSKDDEGLKGWLKSIFYLSEAFRVAKNLGEHLGNYLTGIVGRIKNVTSEIFSDKIGEKLLIDGYLAYSLSNRTNIKNGAIGGENILTGYSFSKVKYEELGDIAAPNLLDVIKLLKDIKNEGEAEMFCGAELEYILSGTRSEVVNQSVVFFQLYFVRMIIDIAPILCNKEVQEILGSVPVLVKIIVIVAYFLIEPYLDALIIVNGGEQSLFKKVVYITPSGLMALITKFTTLGIDVDTRNKIKNKAEGLFDKEISISTQDQKDGLTWDYRNYMIVLMFATGDSETYLKRFKSIIAMESEQYYKSNFTSMNGESYSEFKLTDSYTYIESTIKMKYKSFLGNAGLAANGIYSITRRQMRGY